MQQTAGEVEAEMEKWRAEEADSREEEKSRAQVYTAADFLFLFDKNQCYKSNPVSLLYT